MNFFILTDIEGVTGVTTYEQAEKSDYAKAMLMHDLNAVIRGIKSTGNHGITVFDMHTDGRNINLGELDRDIEVITGKPINTRFYKSSDKKFDGFFLLGLHAMAGSKTLLAHSYLREYERILLNGTEVGEIGIEVALAAERGIPLVFMSGDSAGCEEASALSPAAICTTVKKSLGEFQALCYTPAKTGELLFAGAREAVLAVEKKKPAPGVLPLSYKVSIEIGLSGYADRLKSAHPALFTGERIISFGGPTLLECWSNYLFIEREISTL